MDARRDTDWRGVEGDAGGTAGIARAWPADAELCAEIAEIYAMALLRDVPFADLHDPRTPIRDPAGDIVLQTRDRYGDPLAQEDRAPITVGRVMAGLRSLAWFDAAAAPTSVPGGELLSRHAARRRYARVRPMLEGDFARDDRMAETLDLAHLFRGSVPGGLDRDGRSVGPPVSQFLVRAVGSHEAARPGHIDIPPGRADIAPCFCGCGADADGGRPATSRSDVGEGREELGPVATPRDLAALVHVDRLYQALSAVCLGLAGGATPGLDAGLASGWPGDEEDGDGTAADPSGLLGLLGEASFRALRALERKPCRGTARPRPELFAARLALAAALDDGDLEDELGSGIAETTRAVFEALNHADEPLLAFVHDVNTRRNLVPGASTTTGLDELDRLAEGGRNYILPIAFPDVAPMHPAFDAGHAIVAGACATILKAFLEMYREKDPDPRVGAGEWGPSAQLTLADIGLERVQAHCAGGNLHDVGDGGDLTVMGELNKLAANIASAGTIAGVHYHADAFENLRLGERVAVVLLEEYVLTCRGPAALRFESFDGDRIVVRTDGAGTMRGVSVQIADNRGWPLFQPVWWVRHGA